MSFFTQVQRNNAKECIVNVVINDDEGFAITGGLIVDTGSDNSGVSVPLVTGYRTENQGGTITKHYFENTATQSPWPSRRIMRIDWGNAKQSTGITVTAVTENGNEQLFSVNQSGTTDYSDIGGLTPDTLTGETFGIYVSGTDTGGDRNITITFAHDQPFS
tara:strand:- start:1221 stop:1703 length:483 start_codon:yes stop_codon:yes gene_type:complete